MVYCFHFLSFLGKKTFELTRKFWINISIPILFDISVLLDLQDNLPETNPALSVQMVLYIPFHYFEKKTCRATAPYFEHSY